MRILFALILCYLILGCKDSGIEDDMTGKSGYEAPRVEQKERAHEPVGLTEAKDEERRRQLELMDR
jgi:hypothetical protein